jgi:hypothetical protein
MNQTISRPRLAIIAREFQVGGEADLRSIHVAPRANGSFSFEMNPVGGEELLTVVGVRAILQEEPNDHSLLVLNPSTSEKSKRTKTLTMSRIIPLSAKARKPSSGAQRIHSLGRLAIHDAVLGSQWI